MVFMVSDSCRDCAIGFLESCATRGEDGRCPTCNRGPVKVWSFMFVRRVSLIRSCRKAGSSRFYDREKVKIASLLQARKFLFQKWS